MSGPNLSHPDDRMTFACPKCDHARDLYQREDRSVKCYSCSAEFPRKELVERPTKRGCNLTPELRSKGGGQNDVVGHREIAKLPRKSL